MFCSLIQAQSASLQKRRSSYPPSRTNCEKLAVRDFVGVDREGRHLHRMSFKLVVPAKSLPFSRNPQRRCSCRDIDHPRMRLTVRPATTPERDSWAAQFSSLPATGETCTPGSLRASADARSPRSGWLRADTASGWRSSRSVVEDLVKLFADVTDIGVDLREPGPVGGLVRRKAAAHRIDAKSKEAIEFLVSRLQGPASGLRSDSSRMPQGGRCRRQFGAFQESAGHTAHPSARLETSHRSPTAIQPSGPRAGPDCPVGLPSHSFDFAPFRLRTGIDCLSPSLKMTPSVS